MRKGLIFKVILLALSIVCLSKADTTATFSVVKSGLHMVEWVPSTSATSYVGAYPRGLTAGYSEEVLAYSNLSSLKSVTVKKATFQFKISGFTPNPFLVFPQTINLFEQNHKPYTAAGDYSSYYVNYAAQTEDAPWNSLIGSKQFTVSPTTNTWVDISTDTLTKLIQKWVDADTANKGFIMSADFKYWGYYWTISDAQLVVTYAANAVTVPNITTEPKDTVGIQGAPLSISVSASGNGVLSYAWYKTSVLAGNVIANQVSSTFSLSAAQPADSGVYYCVVKNSAGADTSRGATVKVNTGLPVITIEPRDTAVLASSAYRFSVTASGVQPLTYKWYKNSVATTSLFSGQTSNILSFPSAQPQDSGLYICVVSNSFGADTSRFARLIVAPNLSVNNPIVVRGTVIDSMHVKLTISKYAGLPLAAPMLFPWFTDSVFVWYKANAWPTNPPQRTDKTALSFSVKQLQSKSADQYDTVVSVARYASPSPCFLYDFLGSVNWKNNAGAKDSLPSFADTAASGVSILMCDTAPLSNPLTMALLYSGGADSVTVTILNLSQVDLSKVASLSLSYSVAGAAAITDEILRSSIGSGNSLTKTYKDVRFTGSEKTVQWRVVIKGVNGGVSSAALAANTVGFSRPVNTVALSVDTIKSTQVHLHWTRNATSVDSMRVLYGANPVPLDTPAISYGDYAKTGNLSLLDTTVWITGLKDSASYYFGLQVAKAGIWSNVTKLSSAFAKTLPLTDTMAIVNKIRITALAFDSVANKLTFEFAVDTAGVQLEAGIVWTSENGAFPAPDKASGIGNIVPIVTFAKTTCAVDIVPPKIDFGTKYRFGIWLRKVEGKWASPTKGSDTTFLIPMPSWQKISLFPANTNQLSVFGGKVVLQKDTIKGSQLIEYDVTVRKSDAALHQSGCIPASLGFLFDNHSLPPIPFTVSIHYDSVPAPYSESDFRVYHYDAQKDLWFVDTLPVVVDPLSKTLSISPLGTNCKLPFIVMVDTVRPELTLLSDTQSVLQPLQDVPVSWRISDNIANVKSTLTWGRADDKSVSADSFCTSTIDTFSCIVKGSDYLVISDYGVRMSLSVSDGHFTQRVDLSRSVAKSKSNEFVPQIEQWTPVSTTAILDDPSIQSCLKQLGQSTPWTYDKTKFRLFSWKNSTWFEYSDSIKSQFDLLPGKVVWLKTRTAPHIDFGTGKTVSLKNPTIISCDANGWTDFALPFQFPVRIGDVLLSTVSQGALLGNEENSLSFYEWRLQSDTGKSRMYPEAVYLPGMPGKVDKKTLLSYRDGQGLAYSVNNQLAKPVALLIPPTPVVLSQVSSVKTARANEWCVSVKPFTDDGMLGSVYCGFREADNGTVWYPKPPSWAKVSVGVYDEAQKKIFGNVLVRSREKNGCAFTLAFENNGESAAKISFTLSKETPFAKGNEIAVIDPQTGEPSYEQNVQTVSVGALSREFRYFVVGTKEFIGNSVRAMGGEFRLTRIFPNPFRSSVRIGFAIPGAGIDYVNCQVVDQLGRIVWKSTQKVPVRAGQNEIVWNPKDGKKTAAGMYIVKLSGYDNHGAAMKVLQSKVMYLP